MLDPDGDHATQLVNHWYWRPGHRPGRPYYTWHLTFEDQHDLHRLVTEYHNALRRLPFLDLVPVPWLHMTMQGVGFVDVVADHELQALVGAVRARTANLAALPLQFHQLTARPQALALYPRPVAAVHTARNAIRLGIADAWGADRVPEQSDDYQPHVSVAYVNTQSPTTAVRAALAPHRLTPAVARVEHLNLIMIQRDHNQYRWRVAHSLPLL